MQRQNRISLQKQNRIWVGQQRGSKRNVHAVISEKKQSDALVEQKGQEEALDEPLVVVDVAKEPHVVNLARNLIHIKEVHYILVGEKLERAIEAMTSAFGIAIPVAMSLTGIEHEQQLLLLVAILKTPIRRASVPQNLL